ncbi:AraC family transcriptional regulator [Pseudofulvibacter geojedonensis]
MFLGTTTDKYYIDNCSISIVNYTKPVSEDWHSHEDIHLSLILQGGNLESRKNKDVQVTPGKIISYHQGEKHRNRFTEFPSKNLNLEFNNDFFTQNELSVTSPNLTGTKQIEHYLSLVKIYQELHINDLYTNDSILLSLKSLFTNNNISKYQPNWVPTLKEIIEDRWDEFIPLDELALNLNVHPVTISKYFKKYYNCSLGDYMRKIKVQKAIDLLLHTKMPITEIAYACGFSDNSHMTRIFKLYVGFIPKEIRLV